MLDKKKAGQHVAVNHQRYCDAHPDPRHGTDVRDHFFGSMTFVTDEFAGEVPDAGRDECQCGRSLDSEVRVLSWPPTPLTGEAVVEFLAKTDGLFAIETAAFGHEEVPPDWGRVLPLDPVPHDDECLQVTVIDGHLVTANSYTGDPVYLGDSPDLAVDTLGTICRQLPTAPISMQDCELESLLWEVHDGYDVSESVSAVADVSGIIEENDI